MKYKLKTAPTYYPVSLADVKRNLHIATDDIDVDRDTLIQDLIYDAIIASQNATGRQYCPATYLLYLDEYPEGGEVEITLGPVASITSIKYYEKNAAEMTTLDEDLYQLDNVELTARLRFLDTFSPDTERMNAIEIEFETGWMYTGTQGPVVPRDLKQAVILRACEAYLNPGNESQNFGMGTKIRSAEIKERDYRVQRY